MIDTQQDSYPLSSNAREFIPAKLNHTPLENDLPQVDSAQSKLLNSSQPEPFIDVEGKVNATYTLNARNNCPIQVVFFNHNGLPSYSDDLAKEKTSMIYGQKPSHIPDALWEERLQDIRLKSLKSGSFPAFETEAIQNGEALFLVADDPSSILDFCIRLGIEGPSDEIEMMRSNPETQVIIKELMSTLHNEDDSLPNQHIALLTSFIRGDGNALKVRELLSGNCPTTLTRPNGEKIDAIEIDSKHLRASGGCPKDLIRLAFIGDDLLATPIVTRVKKELMDFTYQMQQEQSHLGNSAGEVAASKWRIATKAGLPIVGIEVVNKDTITMPDITDGGRLRIYGKGAKRGLSTAQQQVVQNQAAEIVRIASEHDITLPWDDPFIAIEDPQTHAVNLLLLDFITLGVDPITHKYSFTNTTIPAENASLAQKALRYMY